jgi:hypothetical protein
MTDNDPTTAWAEPIVEKVAFALHDSMCPERACEPHTMGAYYRSARAVLPLFEPETVTTAADDLYRVATGIIRHDYAGACPDDVEGWGSRDPECAACRVLIQYDPKETS